MNKHEVISILVVEDDRGIRTLLRTILAREGFAVHCVSDGAEALRRCIASPAEEYDCVLLDLSMPFFSGEDFLQALHDRGSDLLSRVLVITAASTSKLLTVSPVPVLRKPFDINDLVVAVRAIAASGRPRLRVADKGSRPAAERVGESNPRPEAER